MSKSSKVLLRILSGLLTLLVAFFLRLKLFPQSSFATLEKIGIHTSFLSQAIVSTGTTLTGDILTGTDLSGALDQLSGQVDTGVVIDMSKPDNYFLIQLLEGDITTLDIYDKNNLNTPIKKISLPESELVFGITSADGIQYFNSRGEYYVLTENAQNQNLTLFKILLDGTIEKIGTELQINPYYAIDQETLQISYGIAMDDGGYDNGIAIYDINTKITKKLSYDARKRLHTKNTTDDMRIQEIYFLKNGIMYFGEDHDAVDGKTQDFFTTCFDTEKNKELSQSECTKLLPNDIRISYKYGDLRPVEGPEPTLSIDGKEIGIFTGIEFIEIIGNNVLGLTYDDYGTASYAFYKLEDVINHTIQE